MKQIKNKLTKKPIKIEDFVVLVPWWGIEEKLSKKDYNSFMDWMDGQTAFSEGVFLEDLKRFLNGEDPFR